MDISFIIPAYNAEKSIGATLESICALSLPTSSFEIIVVDDASMDNTVQVIEEYRERLRMSNIILLQQAKNKRQGAARNRGLSVANGKYVTFVDADDLVMPGLVKAFEYALSMDVDMLHCGMILQRGKEEYVVVSNAPKNEVMSAHTFCEEYHTGETCQSPCSYLYKNAFLQRVAIPFSEGRRMEDTDWVEKHLCAADTIACLDDVIYTYLENTSSTMHTTKYDTCADWWHFSYRRLRYVSEISDKYSRYAERIREAAIGGIYANTTLRRLTRFSMPDYWRIRQRCGKDCTSYLAQCKWGGFTYLVINWPIVTTIILAVACPIARLGRMIVQGTRR